MAVDDRAIVDVEADALGDGHSLAIPAEADEVGGRVEMVHALDFLLDADLRRRVREGFEAGIR